MFSRARILLLVRCCETWRTRNCTDPLPFSRINTNKNKQKHRTHRAYVKNIYYTVPFGRKVAGSVFAGEHSGTQNLKISQSNSPGRDCAIKQRAVFCLRVASFLLFSSLFLLFISPPLLASLFSFLSFFISSLSPPELINPE